MIATLAKGNHFLLKSKTALGTAERLKRSAVVADSFYPE